MAKQVEDIVVRLVGEGFEALDKIKGSFRELGKVTNLAEKDILAARDSLLDYARKAGNTEAVNKGLIDAFKGLRSQVDLSSEAYRSLSGELRRLDEESKGATRSIMAQRDAVLSSTAAGTQNVAALQQQRAALIALRAQTRDASTAFDQFSADIAAVETRLGNLADVNRRFNAVLVQGTAATAAGARVQLQALTEGIALRRQDLADIDTRSASERNLRTTIEQRIGVERRLNTALSMRRRIQFQEGARTGRESARTGAATFNDPTVTAGFLAPDRIAGRIGDLPNTTAGLSQELSELNERLINTYRNTETYIAVQLQLSAVQREVAAATQGFGAALRAQLDAGTLIPSQKNLAEVIGVLRREMLELDQTTTEGTRAYAQNAAQVDRLQQQLDKLAGAYRSVSAASRGASNVTVSGERPFVSEMDRQKQRRDASVDQRAEFERLTAAADSSSLQAVDALQSAKRTMAEAEVSAAQKLDQLKDDLHAKDLQRVDELFKKEVDAFNQKLQLDRRAQQVAATKREMGFFAQSELSPFYGSIAEMGGAGAARQQRFMGRSSSQVLDDIATSFSAGGRTPPVPPSTGGGPSPAANTEFTKLNATLTKFGALNRRSVTDIRELGGALDALKADLSPVDAEYRKVNKSIEAQQTLIQRELGRRERSQRRGPSTGQLVQAGGAAISGGIFGGPEGFFGGVTGAVLGTALPGIGTAGGAFAGAAAGAQLGMLRQQLGGTAEYAASLGKLQIALRGIVGSQSAYDEAIRAAAAATRELNIPQEEATRGLTRLSAAVIGAGGTVTDSSFAFRAMSEAIKATGGDAQAVDGTLLALTQVFSKGKVSAEELNQIAERLPGTFTLFAKAAGKTGPELQKALEQGEVGLNDLMNFLALLGERFGKTALDISKSSQDAGARLTVAFQAMRLEVGNALQPLGAQFQGAFEAFISDITPAVVGSAKAIAAVLSFLTTNDLVAFGVQLTAVSLGFKGLQVAAAALTSLNVASWFTATAVGAKVTSSGMAAATVTTGGLTGAIKALTLAMAKNPLTLLILAGTAAAIKIGSAVLEQKKLNDEVQRSLDIAAKAPASGVATDINTTETALREARSKLAGGLQGSDFFGFGLIAAEQDVARLEGKLAKLKTTFKGRVEIETIFKGLGTVPTGYKVVNGRLAYLSPGQGYIDAETGKPVGKGPTDFPGATKEDKDKAGASLLQAIEQRETALLNLRTQREEQIAQIREQAAEQAKQIETQLADRRLAIERQIQDSKRQSSDFIEDSDRRIRAARGENSDLIAAEQRVVDIFREERDSKLDSERRLADDKKQQEETIAEFQRGVAKSINDANRAHTRSMGEIQKQYATSVAKIIDEGTGKAGKRLEKAAQLAAAYIQRGTANSQVAAVTSGVIPERRQGKYDLKEVGGKGVTTPAELLNTRGYEDVQGPIKTIIKLDDTIERLRKALELSRTPTRTPGIGDQFTALLGAEGASLFGTGFDVSSIATDFGEIASASFISGLLAQNSGAPRPHRVGDTIPGPPAARSVREPQKLRDAQGRELKRGQPTPYRIPVIPSANATTQLRDTQAQTEDQQRQAKTAQQIKEAFADVNREGEQFTNGLNEQLQLLQDQRKFLDMGFSDALSSDLANLDRGLNSSEAVLRRITDQLKVQGVDPATAEAAYDKEKTNLSEVYALNVKLTQELEKQAQALRLRQDDRIGLGMQEGARAYVESVGTMREATAQLTQTGIKGVEDALFSLVTTGTANFREFAAEILKQSARMILQLTIQRVIMQILGAIGGGGASVSPSAPGGDWMSAVGRMNPTSDYAKGGAFAANNIIPYAMGGVVSKPTLFKFAQGGAMQTGLMGEAGPEAIMPLKRGADGRLGVSGGGSAPVNVTVNVDASGSSKVAGDPGQGAQLGRLVAGAVQQELVKQKRPGGLLAGGR